MTRHYRPNLHTSGPDDGDTLDALWLTLWKRFNNWFNDAIKLDAKAIALGTPPTWSTTVGTLYRDYTRWMSDQKLTPADRDQFRDLLLMLGCQLQSIHGELLATGLALREDWLPHQKFENPPPAPTNEKGHQ